MPPLPPSKPVVKKVDNSEEEDRKRKRLMLAIILIAVIGMSIAAYLAPKEKHLTCKNNGPVGLTSFGSCVEE